MASSEPAPHVVADTPDNGRNGAYGLVVIGGSAGGIEALTRLTRMLRPDLDAAVLVVVHMGPDARSRLPELLERWGPLPAAHARDGDALGPGRILVAPPDHHLIVNDGTVRLVRGPHENLHRPAVDPLFRSAARSTDHPLIAVVLSGALDDGAVGARLVQQSGGLVVVQDPDDAIVTGMPRSTIDLLEPTAILSADQIGARLPDLLVEARALERRALPDTILGREDRRESALVEDPGPSAAVAGDLPDEPPGVPSELACPACGGVVWEQSPAGGLRFRCRTGHGFSAASLLAAQNEGLETALWSALRALEEQAALSRRVAERSEAIGAERTRTRLLRRAEFAEDQALVIRQLLADEDLRRRGADDAPDVA